MAYLIFVNGSMNSGKTTTTRSLSKRLNAGFSDMDDIRDKYAHLQLTDAIPTVLREAARLINVSIDTGQSIVACYVLSESDYLEFNTQLDDFAKFFYTLSPDIESVTTQRGSREISALEISRIKHHYEIGVNRPSFGKIIDSTHMVVDDVVDWIIKDIQDD